MCPNQIMQYDTIMNTQHIYVNNIHKLDNTDRKGCFQLQYAH